MKAEDVGEKFRDPGGPRGPPGLKYACDQGGDGDSRWRGAG